MSIRKTPTAQKAFRTPFSTKSENIQEEDQEDVKQQRKKIKIDPDDENMYDSAYSTPDLDDVPSSDSNEINIKEEPLSQGLSEISNFEDDDMMLADLPADDMKPAVKKEVDFDDSGNFNTSSKWSAMISEQMDGDAKEMVDINVDSSSLPLIDVEGEKVLRFFFLDAYEDRYNQPGTVYLFGKVWIDAVKSHVSCSLAVKNIEREVYLLPRKMRVDKNGKELDTEITFKDVYEEFDEKITSKFKIMKFKCRKSVKHYAFEKYEVPAESEYLEIRYPANQPQLPMDLKGETFSHAFGTNTSSLEHLLLNLNIQGPCWINVKHPKVPSAPISWCKTEAYVEDPTHLDVCKESLPCPPLTVLSLSMLTLPHQKTHSHEIISLCGLVHPEVYLDKAAPKQHFKHSFSFVSKPADQLLPFDFQTTIQKMKLNLQMCASERSLLGLFLARMQKIDPDVVVGHDVHGFDFDVLLHRISANKVPHWSKLGRLKRQNMPKLSGSASGKKHQEFTDKTAATGRLVCDVKVSAKELIRCKSYDITELVSVVLNDQRQEIPSDEVPVILR